MPVETPKRERCQARGVSKESLYLACAHANFNFSGNLNLEYLGEGLGIILAKRHLSRLGLIVKLFARTASYLPFGMQHTHIEFITPRKLPKPKQQAGSHARDKGNLQ